MFHWLFRYKNQTVAIKIVHKGETVDEVAKKEARFAREVAMLSRVQHKNLVKVWFDSTLHLIYWKFLPYLHHTCIILQTNGDHLAFEVAMSDLPLIRLNPCVSTVYWCLQGACNGDSNRTFIRRDLTKVPAQHAPTVLGHTCGSWFCTWYCSCYGMPSLTWHHTPWFEAW